MLKLFNKEHVAIGALTKLKDYKIEYLLSGEDSIEFSLSISDENIHLVEEEGYIQNKLNEYVIKAIDPSQEIKRFSCSINIESIVGKSIQNFDTSNNNINDTIRLVIAGTGWILADNNITKRRTVRLKNTNALEVLREVRKVFRVDFRFDSINKIIHVYEQFGSDKGVYFTDELNLRSLDIPSDTYDYATRLYAYGKDGLTIASINDGKEYVDNFQYSNKVIEDIWEDNRYTDINSLKSDAEAKLAELSKPKRSYKASVADLAKYSEEYNFLDFFLGDTITLLSKTEKFRDKQRIVKYIQYPNNPGSNTCELGNTILTFEDIQKENESKNEIIDNITSDNGTVDGSKVDSITTDQISDFEASVAKITDLTVINAEITNLKAQNVNITGKLTAIEAEFGTLKSNVAIIDSLTVTHTAQIKNLEANKASITQLNAVSATIGTLEAEVGKIQTLVNGNLSSENIQAGGITSDKLTISNGFIKNAMIESLDVSKINAGDISTNKFRIISNDGGIEIVGATQQFKDKNNKVRIQMGKDAQGNFNFIIRGEDGTTTLIDHTGIKPKAIADDLIVNNMIASDAVGEKQINYSSFANGFNKDTNTTTLKATKIKLDNQNQSLEVAFNSLKTQSDGTKSLTESHATTINVMQGQINTAINNTQIVKDGQTILLKDDYNRTVQTVNSINSTLSSHTTQINQANGKIDSVETKVNTVERDLNSITARVSSTETTVTTVNNLANNALSTANTANSKALSAEQLAKAMSDSKMIHLDPNFRQGYNNVSLYNNANNGNVIVTRITKVSDCPTTSTHCLEIKHIGAGSPGFGGFCQNITSRANAIFIQKFISKLPVGYSFTTASNSMGTGYTDKWLTSNQGTGKWETYIREVRCGSTGTFSSGGHVYISGSPTPTTSSPLVYYLAYCTCFDLTDNDETVNSLKVDVTTTKSKVSTIETNLNSITSRVSSVESTTTSINGQVSSLSTRMNSAEQKITSDAIVSTVKNHQTDGQSTFVTGTTLNQTVDDFEFKFFNNSDPNLLKNTTFYNDWNYWGWNGQFEKVIYYDGGFTEGNTVRLEFTDENQGLFQRDIDCTHGVAIKVHVLTSRVVDMTIGIEGIYTKKIRMNDGWNEVEVIVPPIPRTGTFIFYTSAGGPHTVYAHKFKVQAGNICTSWCGHRDEIYSNSTIIDKEGIKIKHSNGSMSSFTHEAIDFFSPNGRRTLRVKDGGLNFYTFYDPAEMVGFIKSAYMTNTTWNGVALSTYANGDFIMIGLSSDSNENGWATTPNILITAHGNIPNRDQAGTWFLNKPVFLQTRTHLRGVLDVDPGTHISLYANSDTPHQIFNNNSNHLIIVGDNRLGLGIREGTGSRTGIVITEDGGAVNKCNVDSYANWNFQHYTMYNMNIARSLQAQSFALRSRIKDINESYSTSSMTDGDIRFACRQPEHITNKTLIVELPQIFSENIELDYHINISKLSWGDYRIIEKTPYYFEIETNVDSFSFTYEIVAKSIEKPIAYTSIAKSQFLDSKPSEGIKDVPVNILATDQEVNK